MKIFPKMIQIKENCLDSHMMQASVGDETIQWLADV